MQTRVFRRLFARVPLYEICAEMDIRAIDVLKMDVQGYETEVVRGAVGMLPKRLYVFSEVGIHRDDGESQYFPAFHSNAGSWI